MALYQNVFYSNRLKQLGGILEKDIKEECDISLKST